MQPFRTSRSQRRSPPSKLQVLWPTDSENLYAIQSHDHTLGSRRTILPETLDFTEEPVPVHWPQTPQTSQTVHFLNGARFPGSRRPTESIPYPGYPQFINGSNEMNRVPRKWTQEDQDQQDERVRQQAMDELVQSWMDRLQLISVITTFFAAIEAQLLGITTPDDASTDSRVDQAANAALAGALVVHVFAAIMSFFAAFFLIRYKLSMAKHQERRVEIRVALRNGEAGIDTPSSASVWTTNPHLEQVGPFRRGQPPTHLLDHLHSLCMALSAIGFALALAGVMCFLWSRLATSAGIFASACMGVCLVSGAGAVFWPASTIHRTHKTS
ncbi:hypothetical protein C8Q80DRAFT_495656 [Daedaleopsis nitida]|nr:hypothetical protein C8Q80DRAFT_495656 [Daedaleopsis nitida]